MDLVNFLPLLTPSGQEALAAAAALSPREEDFLPHFTALSKGFPRELARAVLEIAILRREAESKFPQADKLYFTRQALEQASSWEVSAHRAQRYRPFRRLIDLGCSIGGDTLALAQTAPTLGLDLDPLRLHMARANLDAVGLADRAAFLQSDLTHPLPLAPSPDIGLFFDPARRTGGRRVFSVKAYTPPLDTLRQWLPRFPALGVKISPGVNRDELRGYDAEVEFISLRGELKEAVLWFGPLQTAGYRATLLPGPHTLTADTQASLPLSEPRAYIYEPDPAILRARLVEALGAQLDAAQLDPDIAYLTAHHLTQTPFARAWAVEDWLPFQLKRLRAYLRDRNVGQLTVKKRGSPIQPEDLIRALRLKGDHEKIIFLTQLKGKPIAIICTPNTP